MCLSDHISPGACRGGGRHPTASREPQCPGLPPAPPAPGRPPAPAVPRGRRWGCWCTAAAARWRCRQGGFSEGWSAAAGGGIPRGCRRRRSRQADGPACSLHRPVLSQDVATLRVVNYVACLRKPLLARPGRGAGCRVGGRWRDATPRGVAGAAWCLLLPRLPCDWLLGGLHT